MNKLAIIILYCLTTYCFAKNPKGNSFLLTRFGKDIKGVSLYERFHVRSNNLVNWEAVSIGMPDCPDRSGEFVGKISKNNFLEIIKKGKEVISLSKKIKTNNHSDDSNHLSVSLTIWENKQDYFSNIKKWDESVEKLFEMVRRFKKSTIASKAIEITSSIQKNRILVSIKNIGTESYELALPNRASEAFRFNSNQPNATYFKKPKESILKIKQGSTYEIYLNLEKGAEKVYYHNKLLMNYPGNENLSEVAICSQIK